MFVCFTQEVTIIKIFVLYCTDTDNVLFLFFFVYFYLFISWGRGAGGGCYYKVFMNVFDYFSKVYSYSNTFDIVVFIFVFMKMESI